MNKMTSFPLLSDISKYLEYFENVIQDEVYPTKSKFISLVRIN